MAHHTVKAVSWTVYRALRERHSDGLNCCCAWGEGWCVSQHQDQTNLYRPIRSPRQLSTSAAECKQWCPNDTALSSDYRILNMKRCHRVNQLLGSSPLPFFLFLSPPLEVCPLNPARRSESAVSFPWGLEQSSGRNWFFSISALKCDIWWLVATNFMTSQ